MLSFSLRARIWRSLPNQDILYFYDRRAVNCVSYNFFKMSFPWSLQFPSCKILSLSHFCSGCRGSLGDFCESFDFAGHRVHQEAAGVTLVGYFWSLWRYWKHFPVVAFSLLNWSILWGFPGWCQIIFVENERQRFKEQSYRNVLSHIHTGWSL